LLSWPADPQGDPPPSNPPPSKREEVFENDTVYSDRFLQKRVNNQDLHQQDIRHPRYPNHALAAVSLPPGAIFSQVTSYAFEDEAPGAVRIYIIDSGADVSSLVSILLRFYSTLT